MVLPNRRHVTCTVFAFAFMAVLVWFMPKLSDKLDINVGNQYGVNSKVDLIKATSANLSAPSPNYNEYSDRTRIRKPWQAIALLEWDNDHPVTSDIGCKNVTRAGDTYRICNDPPYTIKPPCLVYSFGIDYDFTFDDKFASMGCEVHSFDPSMQKAVDGEKRGPGSRVTFHKIGIGNQDKDGFDARKDDYVKRGPGQWRIKKLSSLMEMLGHKGRHLDMLKLDVESYGWEVLENLYQENILENVRQFIFEWHIFFDKPKQSEYPKLWNLFEKLDLMGFRTFWKRNCCRIMSGGLNKIRSQGESDFVNTKFKYRN